MQRNQAGSSHAHHHTPREHFQIAALTSFLLHPIRLFLNRASYDKLPFETIKNATGGKELTFKQRLNFMSKGLIINTIRGGFATGLQSYSSHHAQHYFDDNPTGKFAALMAAACPGTGVATSIEVALMRRPYITSPITTKNLPSFIRFNRAITTGFFCREIGFSSAVLISRDFSLIAHYAILFSAAWLTASCHKLVTIEATRDLTINETAKKLVKAAMTKELEYETIKVNKTIKHVIIDQVTEQLITHAKNDTLKNILINEAAKNLIKKSLIFPDYNKGILQVISNIANNHYVYPSLRGPIANPSTFFHRSQNILSATCGPNMFLFRLMYLKAFTELLAIFKHQLNEYRDQQESSMVGKKML